VCFSLRVGHTAEPVERLAEAKTHYSIRIMRADLEHQESEEEDEEEDEDEFNSSDDDDQSDPDEIDNYERQLDQLCASALSNLPGSVGKLSQIEKSLANLSLYSEKYENELNRTINQWSDNVALEHIDTAAHLSLNKSLSQMNFLRYEPLGQRVFYNDITGQPACKWDCAFICVHPVRGDDEDEEEDEEEDHYNDAGGVTEEGRNLEKSSRRLSSPSSRRSGSSEELWGEETQEVIYLVTIEKDMTHARLEDVSRRLFLTLDCMNRYGYGMLRFLNVNR
jgi:hypothetical protein